MISKPLSELCLEVVDCPHSTPKWTTEGHLVIRSQNIRNGRLNLDNKSYTDTENFETRSRRIRLRKDDLIITREAPMGEVCIIPADLECCLGQRMVGLRSNPEVIAPRFLLYALQSPSVKHQISWNEGTGSTVSNMRIPALKALEIPLPNVPDQKAIAHILGTLDDKIELNRKMNETLEEIAKAIFKSWFVDFDPVRAKMEGRPTGLPDDIAALFPDRLVDSEIGEIPEGWAVQSTSDLSTLRLGGTPSRKAPEFWGGDVPWINSGKANEFRVIEASEYITKEGLRRSSTKLLPAGTTIVAITGATLGQVSYLEIDTCANQSVVGLTAKEEVMQEWLYLATNANIQTLVSRQTGGAQQHINKNDVSELEVLVGSRSVLEAFASLVKPVFKKIGLSCHESICLTELRDTLLPRLISGELQVPDAEKFLKEAGI